MLYHLITMKLLIIKKFQIRRMVKHWRTNGQTLNINSVKLLLFWDGDSTKTSSSVLRFPTHFLRPIENQTNTVCDTS